MKMSFLQIFKGYQQDIFAGNWLLRNISPFPFWKRLKQKAVFSPSFPFVLYSACCLQCVLTRGFQSGGRYLLEQAVKMRTGMNYFARPFQNTTHNQHRFLNHCQAGLVERSLPFMPYGLRAPVCSFNQSWEGKYLWQGQRSKQWE